MRERKPDGRGLPRDQVRGPGDVSQRSFVLGLPTGAESFGSSRGRGGVLEGWPPLYRDDAIAPGPLRVHCTSCERSGVRSFTPLVADMVDQTILGLQPSALPTEL